MATRQEARPDCSSQTQYWVPQNTWGTQITIRGGAVSSFAVRNPDQLRVYDYIIPDIFHLPAHWGDQTFKSCSYQNHPAILSLFKVIKKDNYLPLSCIGSKMLLTVISAGMILSAYNNSHWSRNTSQHAARIANIQDYQATLQSRSMFLTVILHTLLYLISRTLTIYNSNNFKYNTFTGMFNIETVKRHSYFACLRAGPGRD